ncbi:hypothetical protein GRF29_216g477116 [Pseudopithomyces chartarum]|uniref:Mitochondrial large ribosomal subunit n=1 Tax=Pseudopithomyces chartarum TaxID=1892770 RepID=A0AAN6LQR1_9PLEO|nr:hypothetical protein GRF29_216g477116 [Pseudopithomyces chartarum]
MSARIPVQRLGQSCLAFRPRSTYWISNRAFSSSSSTLADKKTNLKDVDLSNPLLDEYLSKQGGANPKTERPSPENGNLSKRSIFRKEYEIPGYQMGMDRAEVKALKRASETHEEQLVTQRENDTFAYTLDPVPAARRSFERKLVIKSLQKGGRVGKTLRIKRTEREMTYKSQNFPTSVKKLMRLMHQIQGKTVEEALIQMRFSKKRIARDIVKGLQLARDEAIAARGMGLGAGLDAAQVKKESKLIKEGLMDPSERSTVYLADGTRRREVKGAKGTVIELKNGSKKTVVDPTEMYIDQAWATKGPVSKSVEFRARGRTNALLHRSSKFNVLLKEEKTRMRISEEIQKKRENKPLWLPLPDRPVTAQRQYCLW